MTSSYQFDPHAQTMQSILGKLAEENARATQLYDVPNSEDAEFALPLSHSIGNGADHIVAARLHEQD